MKKVKIYQIEDVREVRYAFREWLLAKNDFDSDDYKQVYEIEVEDERDDYAILENMYYKFNCARPDDYNGRSMSVSDIVVIGDKSYYCDDFGWIEINIFKVKVTDNGNHYIGEKLTLSQRTGNYWVDMVKYPYEVIKIINPNKIEVRECGLIFNRPRYYDTIADKIVSDRDGKKLELKWNEKRQSWISNIKESCGYPYYATFGKWEHQPYLD